MTKATAQAAARVEALLPNGFYAFEFLAGPQQLARGFSQDPLIVEVLRKERFERDA